MKGFFFIYSLLTATLIYTCFYIKDNLFYLPYPNAIEFVSGVILCLITLAALIIRKYRKQKILLGMGSIILLFVSVNLMTYFFEWHPLRLSLPFTKSQSYEVDHEPYEWELANFKGLNYKTDEIENYLQKIDDWKRLRGLVVIKDGKIIIEKYQNGATKYSAFNVHSVTKSISSSLTGIAIKKGYLKSENELVFPYFNEYKDILPSNKVRNMLNISHLLSMKGGFKGGDGSQGVEDVIKEGMNSATIGTKFKYYTGAQMLLSAILTKSTKMSLKDFAEKELFRPLGIRCGFWRKVDGYYSGGDETYFTARDLARFGYLFLNKGRVGGQQLISSTWVEKTFTNYTEASDAFRKLGCYQETGYGYGWWILTHNNKTIYTARGKGGQYVILIPDENVVAVIIQEWNLRKKFKTENGYLCDLLSILTHSS